MCVGNLVILFAWRVECSHSALFKILTVWYISFGSVFPEMEWPLWPLYTWVLFVLFVLIIIFVRSFAPSRYVYVRNSCAYICFPSSWPLFTVAIFQVFNTHWSQWKGEIFCVPNCHSRWYENLLVWPRIYVCTITILASDTEPLDLWRFTEDIQWLLIIPGLGSVGTKGALLLDWICFLYSRTFVTSTLTQPW